MTTMHKNPEIFLEGFTTQHFERGDYLWETGRRCENIYFINEGLVRIFYLDENGDEITVHFANKKNFVCDPESFSASEPSSVSALIETPSDVVVLDKAVRKRLEETFSDWNALLHEITEKSLFEKVKLRNQLLQSNAKERFEIFLSTFPGVANQVKAADIASYLGISQFTLSHLKKDL
jgi:CRP-like cAMP-binding protein